MKPRDYDSTVARMAGNIAAGFVTRSGADNLGLIARDSVALARKILAETKRTEDPPLEPGTP